MTPYVREIWVNIGSDHGLLPDGTKPLPKPMLTFLQLTRTPWQSPDGSFMKKTQTKITKISLKITYLKFDLNFPGANELIYPMCARNWPNSQILQCTSSISHNAPFRTEMCTFLFWMVHCGIWENVHCGICEIGLLSFPHCVNEPIMHARHSEA